MSRNANSLIVTSSKDTTFRLWICRETIHSVFLFQDHIDSGDKEELKVTLSNEKGVYHFEQGEGDLITLSKEKGVYHWRGFITLSKEEKEVYDKVFRFSQTKEE